MKRALFVAGGIAAGILFSTSAASATTPDTHHAGIGVQDRKILPGQEVMIVASCWDKQMSDTKFTSGLLDSGTLEVIDRTGDTALLTGSAKVPAGARPGAYTVSFVCHGARVSGAFIVERKTTDKKQVAKVPSGAPQTGGTDGPVDGGPDGMALAAGAMGVLAAGGAGLVVARRRTQ